MRSLRERFTDLAIEDRSRTFNTGAIAALELSFMLEVADAIVNAALAREESRARINTDFPARDDGRFLAHSLIHRPPTASRVEYCPVTIPPPPAERVREVAAHGGPNHPASRALSS